MTQPKTRFPASSEFYSALKQRVAEHFERNGQPTRGLGLMYFKTVSILLWLVGSYLALLLWAQTPLQVVLLSISLGLSMSGIGFNIQHDGNHGGYSKSPFVN